MFKKIDKDLSNINKIEDKIKYLENILKNIKDKEIIEEIKNLIKQFKSQLKESEIERKINQQKIEPLQEQDFISTPFPEVESETPAIIRRNVREAPAVEFTESEEEREIQYIPTLRYTSALENSATVTSGSLYTTTPVLYERDLSNVNLREDEVRQIRRLGLDIEQTSAEQRAAFREHIQHIKIDSVGDHLDKYLNAERNPLREYKPMETSEDVRSRGILQRHTKEVEEGIKYVKRVRGES